MCQAFGALPQEGGLLDQDCYLIEGIKLVLIAQQEKEKLEMDRQTREMERKQLYGPGG